jgi:hypothetical protein
MKQTAVEWLYERFLFAGYASPAEWKEKAKEMEKEQIKDAYNHGQQIPLCEYAEEYYNETYGKDA